MATPTPGKRRRRFGPDTAHFLQQDVFHGALSDLALGTDPISQNRFAMAGGNPLSFIEWDGHVVVADGGGGAIYVNPSSRDACSDMCDSHVTVSASPSTNGGSAHKQDNNPLKQLGDWFGNTKKGVEDKAKQAAQWVYDNSSTISTVAGTAAVVTAFIPGVDAVSPVLFGVAAVTGAMAAHKDMKQGNYGAAALDVLGIVPGGGAIGSLAKDARLAINVGRDLKAAGAIKTAANLGREGEAAANIAKTGERIPSLTGTAAYRVPDELNHAAGTITEVKNVGYQALTNQLRDSMMYANERGYEFILKVRATTKLSGPLQDAADAGAFNLLRELP
ncbi:MAG: hypothetical protein E6I60_07750 [Chloroflexi bacterium]|nr:MAG: hypothetical protein E6I60_07750 [Chloroflexota bacterium]